MSNHNNTKELQLRAFFKSRGLTFKDAAQMLDVHPSAVGNLVSGRNQFGYKVAKRWEDVFGLSADYLITGDGPMMATGEQPATINISRASSGGVAVSGTHKDVIIGNGKEPEPAAEDGSPDNIREALAIIRQQQEQISRLIDIIEQKHEKAPNRTNE